MNETPQTANSTLLALVFTGARKAPERKDREDSASNLSTESKHPESLNGHPIYSR